MAADRYLPPILFSIFLILNVDSLIAALVSTTNSEYSIRKPLCFLLTFSRVIV